MSRDRKDPVFQFVPFLTLSVRNGPSVGFGTNVTCNWQNPERFSRQIVIFVSDRDSFVSQCHGNVFRLIRIYFQKFIDSDNIFFWLCCINPQVTFLGKPKGKFYD